MKKVRIKGMNHDEEKSKLLWTFEDVEGNINWKHSHYSSDAGLSKLHEELEMLGIEITEKEVIPITAYNLIGELCFINIKEANGFKSIYIMKKGEEEIKMNLKDCLSDSAEVQNETDEKDIFKELEVIKEKIDSIMTFLREHTQKRNVKNES